MLSLPCAFFTGPTQHDDGTKDAREPYLWSHRETMGHPPCTLTLLFLHLRFPVNGEVSLRNSLGRD